MKNIKRFKIDDLTYVLVLLSFLSGQLKGTIILFLIIIFHEFGHVFFALIFKYKIKEIIIYPYGGITKIDYSLNESSLKLIILSLGGILFQLLLMLFVKDPLVYKYNLYLIYFNLLPIIPLDGSKFIFEVYSIFFKYKVSMYLLVITSFLFLILYLIFNYYIFNNYLIILLFFCKIFEYLKNIKIYYYKFIIERLLYNYGYHSIDNNINIKDYRKGYKYYYFKNNRIINEKEYLKEEMS